MNNHKKNLHDLIGGVLQSNIQPLLLFMKRRARASTLMACSIHILILCLILLRGMYFFDVWLRSTSPFFLHPAWFDQS